MEATPLEAKRLYPSEQIRCAEIDDLFVILDLKSENYHILDERASLIWEELIGSDGSAALALQRLASRVSVDPSILATHFNKFVSQCVACGYLSDRILPRPEDPCSRRSKPGRPLFLTGRALRSLIQTGWALKSRGFGRTYLRYGMLPSMPESPGVEQLLPDALRAFLIAENFVAFRNSPDDCLPRSLSLFRFLRSIGIPAIHRIGGRRVPVLKMHAWVEVNSKVLLDDPTEPEKDIILASLPRSAKPPDRKQ